MLNYFNALLGLTFNEQHLGDILFKFYYNVKELTQKKSVQQYLGLRPVYSDDYSIKINNREVFYNNTQITCSTIDYVRRLIYFCDDHDKISVRRLDDMQLVAMLPKPRGKNINISSLTLINDLLLAKCSGSVMIYNTKPFEYIDSIFGIFRGVIANADHLIIYIQYSDVLIRFKLNSKFKLIKLNEMKLSNFQDIKVFNNQLYILDKELKILHQETFELLEQLPLNCTSFNINPIGEMVYWSNNCFTVDGNQVNVGENILNVEFNGDELRIYQPKSLSIYNRRTKTIRHDRIQHINFFYQ